jgi:hypothetical protein
MQILLFSGFHPIIYGKTGVFATAKIFLKNLCPGNESFGIKYGDSICPVFCGSIRKTEKEGAFYERISVHYIKRKAGTDEHGCRMVPQ